MEQINREEITRTSKWARLVYMLIYVFIFNFSIPFLFGFALIQFVFFLLNNIFLLFGSSDLESVSI